MSGTFAIYEMETAAELEAANERKYLVNHKFSEFAMTEMNVIEDLIAPAVRDSKYAYGVGFCDTIKECELFYTADIPSRIHLEISRISMFLKHSMYESL